MQVFGTLDLCSGYWQVPMEDAKDSIQCRKWSVGFGLCNGPATFEQLMEQALSGLLLSVALVYIDDILVPRRTFNDHLSNIRTVFLHITKAKLKLAFHKCTLL